MIDFRPERIIPDHPSNASGASLLDCWRAMRRARPSRVSSRIGTGEVGPALSAVRIPVIYPLVPRKHKQKRQAPRYARVRLANDSVHIRTTWIPAADTRPQQIQIRIRIRICGRYPRRGTRADFARRARPPRLFAVAHGDQPQTTRDFQSKQS